MRNNGRKLALFLYSFKHTSKNAISGAMLAKILGVSKRSVRHLRTEAIKLGFPVCGDFDRGYYWGRTKDIPVLNHMAKQPKSTLYFLNRSIKNIGTWKHQRKLKLAEFK